MASQRGDRISLGTIPVEQLRQHFAVFSIGSLLMLAVRVYNGIVIAGGDPTWHQVIDLMGEKGGSTMAACLGFSAIAVEGVNMVIAELMKRRRRQESLAEGEARGLVEGQDRMHRLWTEWLSRKEASEVIGEPFNEPPPQPGSRNGRDA